MRTQRQLVGRITLGLLLIWVAAACGKFGPQLAIDVDNSDGPMQVTVDVDSSGMGMTRDEDVVLEHGVGSGWSVPLGSTWEVKIDGKHVIGSGDRPDLAQPSPGQRQDVRVNIRLARDGTPALLEACFDEDYGADGRCAAQ